SGTDAGSYMNDSYKSSIKSALALYKKEGMVVLMLF
ncbi:MAG: hypothetical protein ACI9XC_001742, partial [Gammaproteobacteria bacterium]